MLEAGIAFVKRANPSASNEGAKETAIRMVQDKANRIWLNDSTGYIDSEYKAFYEAKEDLLKRWRRNKVDPAIAAAIAKRKEENEERRVNELRNHCEINNLDFKTENEKSLKEYKKTYERARKLDKLGIAIMIIAVVFVIGFPTIVNYLVHFLIALPIGLCGYLIQRYGSKTAKGHHLPTYNYSSWEIDYELRQMKRESAANAIEK